MLMDFCLLPASETVLHRDSANDACFHIPYAAFAHAGSVRMLRPRHTRDMTRFALSGKFSDVCHALERLVAQEHAREALALGR